MKLYKIRDKFLDACEKLSAMIGRWLGVVGKPFATGGKYFTICSISLMVIIIGAGGYYISQHKLNEQGSTKIVQAVQIKSQLDNRPVVIKANDNGQKLSDEEIVVYNKMHKMINTKIVAKDGKIWGEVEVTPDKCNQLITEVSESGYPDKATLIQFLTRWKNKNFNSGVGEHNYLWDGLNGTIGKAKSLKQ